jgi:RHS repeat-associated protein
LVKKVAPEDTTLYVGSHYEVQPLPVSSPPPPQPPSALPKRAFLPLVFNNYLIVDGQPAQIVKYYLVGGQRIASRTGSAGPAPYYYHDHLGSTVASSGGENTRYWPFGATRGGGVSTAYQFTGQRREPALGLCFYNARWYDPLLGRFLQPDLVIQAGARSTETVLPLTVSYADSGMLQQWNEFQRNSRQAGAPTDPQLLNRYAYARNNPLAYTDDTGHVIWWVVGGIGGAVVGFGAYALTHQENFNWQEAALWTGGGAVVGATFGAGAQLVAGALGAEAAVAAGTAATTAASASGIANRVTPDLGGKLNYMFGQATGSLHNIQRSQDMLRQIQRIGLSDNAVTRQYLTDHFAEVVNSTSNVVKTRENGRVLRESLLMGPNGALKVESIWEGTKLITMKLLGG